MNEINVPDPWTKKTTENNVETQLSSPSSLFTLRSASMTQYVGYWRVNDYFYISVFKRPNRFHRMMTKLLLGWVWVDQ